MHETPIIAVMATALLAPFMSAKCAYNEAGTEGSEISAVIATCDNQDAVAECFAGMKTTQLYDCLISSGCNEKQANIIQLWHDIDCEDVQASSGDRRRRQAIRRVAAPVTDVAIVPRATPLAQPITARQERPFPTPLVCLTTTMIPTSNCITTTEAEKVGTFCQPTTSPSVSCNEGLMCSRTSTGDTVCMVIENTPNLAGIIVSGFLGLCFFLMFGSVLFMSIRSRSRTRRAEKQKEAMLIASGAKSDLRATASETNLEARLPLMQQQALPIHNRDVSGDYSGPRPYSERRGNSRRASPGGSPFRDSSSMGTSSLSANPAAYGSGSGDVGLSTEARNPLNLEDNDTGYRRHT